MDSVFKTWDGRFQATGSEGHLVENPSTEKEGDHTSCHIVGVMNAAGDLDSFSLWVTNAPLPLDPDVSPSVQVLGQARSIRDALKDLRGDKSMLAGHPSAERLWEMAAIYDLTGAPPDLLYDGGLGLTRHSGDAGLWNLYLSQVEEAKRTPISNHASECKDDHEVSVPETGQQDESSPCLLYTSPSPRDRQKSRMPSSA